MVCAFWGCQIVISVAKAPPPQWGSSMGNLHRALILSFATWKINVVHFSGQMAQL